MIIQWIIRNVYWGNCSSIFKITSDQLYNWIDEILIHCLNEKQCEKRKNKSGKDEKCELVSMSFDLFISYFKIVNCLLWSSVQHITFMARKLQIWIWILSNNAINISQWDRIYFKCVIRIISLVFVSNKLNYLMYLHMEWSIITADQPLAIEHKLGPSEKDLWICIILNEYLIASNDINIVKKFRQLHYRII